MRIGATVTRPVIGVVLISRLLGRRVATPVGSQQSRTGVNRSTRCALRRLSRCKFGVGSTPADVHRPMGRHRTSALSRRFPRNSPESSCGSSSESTNAREIAQRSKAHGNGTPVIEFVEFPIPGASQAVVYDLGHQDVADLVVVPDRSGASAAESVEGLDSARGL